MRLLVLLLLAGCAVQVPLRASSTYVLRIEDSRIELPAPPEVIAGQLEDLMRGHGMFITARYPLKQGIVWFVYKGEQRRAGRNVMPTIEGHEIGSWFLARLAPSAKGTELTLIGKPTLDDVEVCAESDGEFRELGYHCEDRTVRSDYPPEKLPRGAEEASIVSAVFEEFRAHYREH